jgi:hypothetical protein
MFQSTGRLAQLARFVAHKPLFFKGYFNCPLYLKARNPIQNPIRQPAGSDFLDIPVWPQCFAA